jgi:hypothetical protein
MNMSKIILVEDNPDVCKPVEFDRFTEAVSQLGLYWALINQPLPTGVNHP